MRKYDHTYRALDETLSLVPDDVQVKSNATRFSALASPLQLSGHVFASGRGGQKSPKGVVLVARAFFRKIDSAFRGNVR